MTQTTARASVTSQTIAVEHIRISSGRPFAEVRRKLEDTVPKLDTGIAEALGSGNQKRVNDYEQTGPKLSIFGERDHGALLQIVSSRRNALQYEIGNPLTASKMTRHQLPAALYAAGPWKMFCAMLPSNGGRLASASRLRGRNRSALLFFNGCIRCAFCGHHGRVDAVRPRRKVTRGAGAGSRHFAYLFVGATGGSARRYLRQAQIPDRR
jgi:hypothetical protein